MKEIDTVAEALFNAWQSTPCSELDGEYTLRFLDLSPDYRNAWRTVAQTALRAQVERGQVVAGLETCSTCGGHGRVTCGSGTSGWPPRMRTEQCAACDGTGKTSPPAVAQADGALIGGGTKTDPVVAVAQAGGADELREALQQAIDDLSTASSFLSKKARDRHQKTLTRARAALAAQPARAALSEEDIFNLYCKSDSVLHTHAKNLTAFARAIEAAHGITPGDGSPE